MLDVCLGAGSLEMFYTLLVHSTEHEIDRKWINLLYVLRPPGENVG